MQASTPQAKPGRPRGVTLAIIAGVLIYAVIPLMWVGSIVAAERVFNDFSNELSLNLDNDPIEAGASGGEFRGDIEDIRLLTQGALSFWFIVVAFFAWLGRPAFMRWVYIMAVVVMAIFRIWFYITPVVDESEEILGGGSLQGIVDFLLTLLQSGDFLLIVLVPVYVVWYLNRGPARAFYRGYYLEDMTAQDT